ncbi:MAG: OmpA family protein [Flavobacterium sp.]|nr:OmpA family protein [Flavobacterium sp.]
MKSLCVLFFLIIYSNCFSQEQFSVYFNSNKSDLTVVERQKLSFWIVNNFTSRIIAINGYCDEDGSSGFNDTLAQKRIDYVFNFVKNKVKFRSDCTEQNFGEDNNLSRVKAENRKVTLFYIEPKDFEKEEEIIKRNTKIIKAIKSEIFVDKLDAINAPDSELYSRAQAKEKLLKSIKYPDKLVFDNPNGTVVELKMDTIFMKKINESTIGEKLKIENLNFIINTFAVVNDSRAKLFELMFVMKSNPLLKIEIQGNLCCAKNDRQDLSSQRARAVCNFLISKEIDKSRLSYKGLGVTQPLYPIPEKDEMERAANRRVEILIIDN